MVRKTAAVCEHCAYSTRHSKKIRRHMHRLHGPVDDVCSTCTEPFLTPRALEQHTEAKHEINPSSFNTSAYIPVINARNLVYAPIPNGLYALASTANLDEYIAEHIQPTDEYLRGSRAVVNGVVSHLQHGAPGSIQPREVVKGGSLEKGTAVIGKSDADLELVLSRERYPTVRDMVGGMKDILPQLKTHLMGNSDYTFDSQNAHSVQIETKMASGDTMGIDVLPACDLIGSFISDDRVTRKQKLRGVYNEMGTVSNIQNFYSVSLTRLQCEFVREKPTKVKSLIRLVKYWKKENILQATNSGKRAPTSYVYELIVIGLWEKMGRPEDFDMRRAAFYVMRALTNHKAFRIVFDDFYSKDLVATNIRDPPYIMDPANPYNDVYKNWDWDVVKEEARKFLRQPIFSGLVNVSSW